MCNHEHPKIECGHKELEYCSGCGKVYCRRCGKEWGGTEYVYPFTYPTYPTYPYPAYPTYPNPFYVPPYDMPTTTTAIYSDYGN